MDLDQILRQMQNAGFLVHGADSQFIYIEEPSCILRAFATFAEYAWLALLCVTILLLAGWGFSMIRGSKNDMFSNMRNLILIFGIMSATGPIVNLVFGDDLFARGCKTVQISIEEIQKHISVRDAKLSPRQDTPYEELDIYDTGANFDSLPDDPDAPDAQTNDSDSSNDA